MKIRFALAPVPLVPGLVVFLFAGMTFAANRGWVVFPSPNSGQTNYLTGVTAVSSSDAWTVGYAYDSSSNQINIVQHWDGTQWSTIPSPNPGTAQQCGGASYAGNELASVAAISSGDVWSVGSLCGPGTARTLAIHWDGNGWSVVTSPNHAPLDDSELLSVSARSSDDVWAVGDYQVAFQYQWETLIEHWDGSAWSIVPSPNPNGSQSTHLTGVAATASNDVWAVGHSDDGAKPLTEHYDGQTWSIVPVPYPARGSFNGLYGVTAISANDIWAVGYQNVSD